MASEAKALIDRGKSLATNFDQQTVLSLLREQGRHVTADIIEGLCDRVQELEAQIETPRKTKKRKRR